MKLHPGSKAGIVGANELAVEGLKNCAKQKRERAETVK